MAEAVLPYTQTNGTTADATKVQASDAALRDFINTELVHRDGSKSFTGLPELPTTSPGTNNPVRKGLLDSLLLLKLTVETSGLVVKMGSASTAVDGSGNATVIFGAAFPTSIVAVFTQETGTSERVKVTAKTVANFTVKGPTPSATVTFDWIAFGT